MTPETYRGADRAERFTGTPPTSGTRDYGPPAPTAPPPDSFVLSGRWKVDGQSATAVADAALTATVQARFVYLVLSPPRGGRTGAVDVRIDGSPSRRVTVDGQRLYTLGSLPHAGRHVLQLSLEPGTAAYAFTFG
jgi:hypothetical protein